ncbi:hypothetical protein M436DRAFT_74462 [Aureobasidium namibiae CBS 147.97]|uniref:MYND-type domain-containing protein n=1 Tax=Aureobasidium namibiae CBS 147.97 TaxID=1043004 RepID=A0A074X9U4_9PEZI|nr:uncharacterized protein M436DRAFT_74462 [Aureobasidium namibiae CBS 147.97]KEQ71396.1 hypothetical protein M436DRAFT_74462 [Aureobasidium namibiae CBS 147.97]
MAVTKPPSPQETPISSDDPRDDSSSTGTPTNKADDLSDVKTPDDQLNNKNKCANCGCLDANAYCAGCHQAPNTDGTPHVNVRYCTRECQKAHWPSHRIECKNLQARKALFRAAWLLQKIWYAVRRESFDNDLVSAEEVNGELLIQEGNYDLKSTKRENGFYREFPDAIFKNKQDAEASLNLLYCTDSVSHMYMVNHWLLKDICMDVKETKVRVQKPARKSRYACDEWNQDFLHEVLQVRLHSGEVYAIDFTGAQYGWYEPITEWSRYSLRCKEIIRVLAFVVDDKRPLGSRARSMLMGTFTDPWDDRSDVQRAIPMFGECLKREFNKVFVQEVVSKHPRGLDILKLEARKFEAVEKEILSLTKQIAHEAAEKVDVLLPIIIDEAYQCNEEMRKQIAPDTGAILKRGLLKLAALFNGEWLRDDMTGRLTSVSLKRLIEDEDYAVKCMKGVLVEQELWGNLNLNHGLSFI